MGETKWWNESWNWVRGCTPVSPACRLCYARRAHKRLLANPIVPSYSRPFDEVHVVEEMLDDPAPLHWRKPRICFVNDLSDTFHEAVPLVALVRAFEIMREAERHTFLVLTKRAHLMAHFAELGLGGDWPVNVWAGVTVEMACYLDRLDVLCEVPARVRFLSVEPLLSPVAEFLTAEHLKALGWIIVGGETGPPAENPVRADPDEVRNFRSLCEANEIPLWFKQWGGTPGPPAELPELDGEVLSGRPVPGEEYPVLMDDGGA